MTNQYLTKLKSLRLWLTLLGLAAALAILTWPASGQAGSGLPGRETPTPTRSENKEDDDDGPPPGAYIELAASPAQGGLWAGVQWQDSKGGWHEVAGWQGSLTPNGRRRWWVAPKDFGTGPFRWQVRAGPHGPVRGASDPFYLPQTATETVQVPVDLAP